jgi:hypothetical protein
MIKDKFGGSSMVLLRRRCAIARSPKGGDGFIAHVLWVTDPIKIVGEHRISWTAPIWFAQCMGLNLSRLREEVV